MPEREGSTEPSWDDLVARVRRVAADCSNHSLERLRVVDGEVTIEVRRGAARQPRLVSAPAFADAGHEAMGSNGEVERVVEPAYVRSDVVGIVHLSRPAVGAGTQVEANRELAYVESLGVRNPITSGGPGRVVKVLVSDGQPVEYGQALFALER